MRKGTGDRRYARERLTGLSATPHRGFSSHHVNGPTPDFEAHFHLHCAGHELKHLEART